MEIANNKLCPTRNAILKHIPQSDQESKNKMEQMFKVMPRVTTTGGVPNGREIEGYLFHFSQGKVCVVCVCHGHFLSPKEFVRHAGGSDLENPMRLIHVSSSSSLSEGLAVSPELPAQILTRLANQGNNGFDHPPAQIKEINLISTYDPEKGTQDHQCNYHPNTDQLDLNLSLSFSGGCGKYCPALPKESMPPTSSPSAAIGVCPTPRRRMSWKQRAREAYLVPQEMPPSMLSEASIGGGATPRRRMSWKKRAREAYLVPQEMPPSVLSEAAIGVGPTPRRRMSWKQRAREAHLVPQEMPPSVLSEAAIGVGPTPRRRMSWKQRVSLINPNHSLQLK